MTDPTPTDRRSPLEHERDACPLGDDCDLTTAWLAGAMNARRRMEAERDTAIAAAYEAAARAADPAQMTCLDAYDEGRLDAADDIRALTPADAIAAQDADRARVRREALEDAAKVADECQRQNGPLSSKGFSDQYRLGLEAAGQAIAAAIRAMIKEEGND